MPVSEDSTSAVSMSIERAVLMRVGREGHAFGQAAGNRGRLREQPFTAAGWYRHVATLSCSCDLTDEAEISPTDYASARRRDPSRRACTLTRATRRESSGRSAAREI